MRPRQNTCTMKRDNISSTVPGGNTMDVSSGVSKYDGIVDSRGRDARRAPQRFDKASCMHKERDDPTNQLEAGRETIAYMRDADVLSNTSALVSTWAMGSLSCTGLGMKVAPKALDQMVCSVRSFHRGNPRAKAVTYQLWYSTSNRVRSIDSSK